MPRKIFFHVGAHKAASTTIQQNLMLNEKSLRKNNIHIFLKKQIVSSDFLKFINVVKGNEKITKADYEILRKKAKNSFEKLIATTPKDVNILFSYEGFIGYSSFDIYGSIYPHSANALKELRYVTGDLETKIILITRRQDNLLESCYVQQVKDGRFVTPEEFQNALDMEKLSWLRIADEIEEVFGQGSAFIYPMEKIKNGTELFLRKILNFVNFRPKMKLKLVEEVNTSPSDVGVELLHAINRYIPQLDIKDVKLYRKLVNTVFTRKKYGSTEYIPAKVKQRIVSKYAKDNANLFKQYIPQLGEDYYS